MRPLKLLGKVRCVLKGFNLVIGLAAHPQVGEDDDLDLGFAVGAVAVFVTVVLRADGFGAHAVDGAVRLQGVGLDDAYSFVGAVVGNFLLTQQGNAFVGIDLLGDFKALTEGPVFEDMNVGEGPL